MKCPFCGYYESKVIDSRPTDEGERIRRRRECLGCGKRFTTYEIIETLPLVVLRACEKRPITFEMLNKAVDEIESMLQNTLEREVPSHKIGELAMEKLKDIDQVAYVRFASVYRQFSDINSFLVELKKLLADKEPH